MCPRLKMVSRGFTFEGNLNRGARLRTIRYRGQLPATRLYIASLIDPPCTSVCLFSSHLTPFPLFHRIHFSSLFSCRPRFMRVKPQRARKVRRYPTITPARSCQSPLSSACSLPPLFSHSCPSFLNSQLVLDFVAPRHLISICIYIIIYLTSYNFSITTFFFFILIFFLYILNFFI